MYVHPSTCISIDGYLVGMFYCKKSEMTIFKMVRFFVLSGSPWANAENKTSA